ncbi:MAG: phosphoheptose isomerase [Bdellovibrionaceae bacterium]|nr:phosphoheptose isomerase [Pseudobdellovibrionaceae bacterium]|tara:strand:+ start:83817 stop:84446 length:630 start_codon:yes stop_codon:yes gene_type:complete
MDLREKLQAIKSQEFTSNFYSDYIDLVSKSLSSAIITDEAKNVLDANQGIKLWGDWTAALKESGNTMYFVGNGASSTMASHMSADATKNGNIKAKTFNDQALMTAISNDISYEQVYSLPVKKFAVQGDILVTISSSGNSPNIVSAIEAALDKGMKVITLSGMNPENQSRSRGTLNVYVPAPFYGVVESCHQVILHAWLDQFLYSEGCMI